FPGRDPCVRPRGHRQRLIGRLQHEGVQRPGLLDRFDVGAGDLGGREALGAQPLQRLLQRESGELAHSTTFGTTKKLRSALGALAITLAGSPPSVTTSSRIGSFTATAEVIGSTPSVSTSLSCSIQAMMPDSSRARGSRRSSDSLMRASFATLRT